MIVITGASDGLGREVAKLYAVDGTEVVNVSRRPSDVADENILTDLSDPADIVQAAKKILAMEETIDALILCAGHFTGQLLGEIQPEVVEKTFQVNVASNIELVSALIERIKHDGTDVVVVVSTTGTKATSEFVYGSSKWAQRGFTLGLQQELKHTPCRVISFCPGGMNTGLFVKGGEHVDTSVYMNPGEVAKCLKQLLELPKNMEVSEIVINRKPI